MQLRSDPVLDRAVVIAEQRRHRPNNFPAIAWPAESSLACPFCQGNEAQTPGTIDQRLDESGQWRVRVVPNKFPVVSPLATETAPAGSGPTPSLADAQDSAPGLDVVPAAGGHEVIIESPRHLFRTSQLTIRELADVLDVYAARLRAWRDVGRYGYGLVFKNLGPEAGASLVHLHSQLLVLERMPPRAAAQHRRMADHHRATGRCVMCDHVARERHAESRIVLENDRFLAFCPFVSLQPYETWLVPRDHAASFEDLSASQCLVLAQSLHDVLSRLENLLAGGGYNLLLHTADWAAASSPHFHWRIEIVPRLNALAGLELATGLHINHVAPERAAHELKSLDLAAVRS